MSDRDKTRRRFVNATGAALVASLAGCANIGGGPGDDSDTSTTTSSSTTSTSTTTDNTTNTTTDGNSTDDKTTTPHDLDSVHFHGTLEVVINGTRYHFDEPKYMEERTGDPHFHFHTDGQADRWHVHSKGVTLAYAADAMPDFDLTKTTFTFEQYTYDDSSLDSTVWVKVNGETVDPETYVLEDGDTVSIEVDTDKGQPEPSSGNSTSGNTTTTEDDGW